MGLTFILLYSFLPHKVAGDKPALSSLRQHQCQKNCPKLTAIAVQELRFIIYALPLLNLAAAVGIHDL